MKNWKSRENKQKKKKNRMIKSGRSLLTVIEPIILKKSDKIKRENSGK
jgi:hypothetical protein